jgi:hypothetical protein
MPKDRIKTIFKQINTQVETSINKQLIESLYIYDSHIPNPNMSIRPIILHAHGGLVGGGQNITRPIPKHTEVYYFAPKGATVILSNFFHELERFLFLDTCQKEINETPISDQMITDPVDNRIPDAAKKEIKKLIHKTVLADEIRNYLLQHLQEGNETTELWEHLTHETKTSSEENLTEKKYLLEGWPPLIPDLVPSYPRLAYARPTQPISLVDGIHTLHRLGYRQIYCLICRPETTLLAERYQQKIAGIPALSFLNQQDASAYLQQPKHSPIIDLLRPCSPKIKQEMTMHSRVPLLSQHPVRSIFPNDQNHSLINQIQVKSERSLVLISTIPTTTEEISLWLQHAFFRIQEAILQTALPNTYFRRGIKNVVLVFQPFKKEQPVDFVKALANKLNERYERIQLNIEMYPTELKSNKQGIILI